MYRTAFLAVLTVAAHCILTITASWDVPQSNPPLAQKSLQAGSINDEGSIGHTQHTQGPNRHGPDGSRPLQSSHQQHWNEQNSFHAEPTENSPVGSGRTSQRLRPRRSQVIPPSNLLRRSSSNGYFQFAQTADRKRNELSKRDSSQGIITIAGTIRSDKNLGLHRRDALGLISCFGKLCGRRWRPGSSGRQNQEAEIPQQRRTPSQGRENRATPQPRSSQNPPKRQYSESREDLIKRYKADYHELLAEFEAKKAQRALMLSSPAGREVPKIPSSRSLKSEPILNVQEQGHWGTSKARTASPKGDLEQSLSGFLNTLSSQRSLNLQFE